MPKKQEYWPGYLSDRIYFIFNDKFRELGFETVVLIVKGTAVFLYLYLQHRGHAAFYKFNKNIFKKL